MTLGQWILLITLLVSCVLLILVILIQRGRGEGLAGAFGGGGGSAFGAKTGDVFTGITVAFACVFLLLNVFGNYIFIPAEGTESTPVVRQPQSPAPTSAPAPVAGMPVPRTQSPAQPVTPAPRSPGATEPKPEAPQGGQVPTPAPEGGESP
jgi:preprotein translocase subunit SecG